MIRVCNIAPWLLLLGLVAVLGSGCGNSSKARSWRTVQQSDQTYENESDYTDGSANEDAQAVDDPRSPAREKARYQRHRQSMRNLGQWVLTAIIGIGINLLLAILLFG
ncbi:MAG: hypothetical protein AAGN35_08630 [Bacteroidota bacterium]